jgi:queuosine precursor transporter
MVIDKRLLYATVIASVLYVSAQIFADITSLRILLIGGLSIDGGTLIYPFTFTLRDVIHKTAGAAMARTVIISAAGINIVMAFLFWIVAQLPADMAVGEQAAFGEVLAPVFRIVLASIIAEVISELIDTEIYQQWVKRFKSKWQWGRVVASNAISVPIDSAIFVAIAFLGDVPNDVALSIFISNVLVKGFVSILVLPMIYTVPDYQLKEQEQTQENVLQ